MNLSHLSIRRPVGTLALASVVFVLGLFFVDRLPIDLLPNIEYPHIRVTVNHPGVAPEVMEEQVTRVLERNLAATENLTRIYSRASEGRTNVNLLFEYGTNLDLALQDASRYLELARTQLPPDIEPPRLYKFDPSQDPVWQAGFSSTVRSEVEVRDWVENRLAPQLLAIHGVSGVEAAGGMVREMEVIVDQVRLRSYGLTMKDLIDTLEAENVDIAAGWVTGESFDVMAKTDGLFTSVADIENVLIDLPGDTRQRIRLSDVASVRDGHREQRLFVRLNGTPAAQISVFKLPEANTVEVVDQVQATLARLERSGYIPEDIAYQATTDPAFFIRGAIGSVATAAILGGVLAMLMVLLFLGSLRKGFVIGLSIPIAIMAAFALMGASGLTLNIISLGGLALGVGLLVDNAIVMLENIYRHREQLGKSSRDSALDGSREVVSAITASTLTNLAAVLPFLLITGIASLIFRDLILTIAFAIIATLAAALTLVPMLAALLGEVRFTSGLEHSRPLRAFNRGIGHLRRGYRRLLPRVLRWRWAVVGLAGMALVGAWMVSTQLGNEFLPQVDDGNVSVRMVLPPGTPPQETDAAVRQIEQRLQDLPHVETVFSMVGGHLSGGIINERPGTANLRVQLTPARDRPGTSAGEWVADAQQALDELDLPGARISVRPPSIPGLRFGTGDADLEVGIVGEDLDQLQRLAGEVSARLEGIAGLEGVEVGREDRSPLLRIIVDRERAADLGMRVSEVGGAIRDAVDGAVPTRFLTQNQEYDVRVRMPRERVADTEALGGMLLFRQEGEPVLLRDVARFELGEGPAHIERENQSRIARVNGDINTAVADTGTIMAQVEERLADLELPDDYSLIFSGQWETIQETQRELLTVVLLAVFLVFVVLAVQYERLSNPLVILSAAPLSLVGVVSILWLTQTPLSAPVMIGVVLLVGIVVNNAILLVEYIEMGRRVQGLGLARAVVRAGSVRLRPILMTTSTTVLGMTPLATGMGSGTEIMQPLALTVIGGLLVSMLLTLLVVPCLYLILGGAAQGMKRMLMGHADSSSPGLSTTAG
ncbi:efflux RND transporter permease subunit [Ectothiorhodospira haloalkaliphila]|uniref:efflux RND transporter permease subunit n=1 Tax=Ectothiorhodospira haloalkaliphila TaxID=421628 RepID=UPI001EE7F020|nr:efflux RND transporter permease subunit [Ectothiorhodospira haloalkaliphila]MCG5524752.1 efflux RND transporter permease subunit [Ectothiorhodospira haloalkaliphila]